MAGLVGTLGMLAEASGAGADLDVAAVPAPGGVTLADWLACFPGFAVVAADRRAPADPGSAGAPPPARPGTAAGTVTSARCGRLRDGAGVDIVWPDGERIRVVDGPVTGMGQA